VKQRDACPDCGESKVKDAKRCKSCNTEMQRKSMGEMFNGNSPTFHANAEVELCRDGTRAHDWLIETPVPEKPTSLGRCRKCPVEREFQNQMDYDVSPSVSKPYFNPVRIGDYIERALQPG